MKYHILYIYIYKSLKQNMILALSNKLVLSNMAGRKISELNGGFIMENSMNRDDLEVPSGNQTLPVSLFTDATAPRSSGVKECLHVLWSPGL